MTTTAVSVFEHFARGLGETTRANGVAYGYSVVITTTFGVVHALDGGPSVGECLLFAIGPSIVFSVLAAVVTHGFRQRVDREPPVVMSLAVALSLLSICASLGGAILVSWATTGAVAWFFAPLVASAAYLFASGAESAIARGLHAVAGTDNLERR
ncbi:MAG: hypothetical protein ACJ77E_08060 [Gaiellaceae bacterium]